MRVSADKATDLSTNPCSKFFIDRARLNCLLFISYRRQNTGNDSPTNRIIRNGYSLEHVVPFHPALTSMLRFRPCMATSSIEPPRLISRSSKLERSAVSNPPEIGLNNNPAAPCHRWRLPASQASAEIVAPSDKAADLVAAIIVSLLNHRVPDA